MLPPDATPAEEVADKIDFGKWFLKPKPALGDVEVHFDEMSPLEWRAFITQFDARPSWLQVMKEYDLTEDVLDALIKPRLPNTPPRTMDTNIFAPKGMGKSYLLLNLKECVHDHFRESFDWSVWFMSPTQFLIFSESADEATITEKVLGIDEPRIGERGEGSGTLRDRFMHTRATIRPRRTVILQASERYISTSPNLIIKPVYLDERNKALLSLVLSPDMFACYGSMVSGMPSKRVCKEYDRKRLDFEAQVRGDKSEVRAYWEPFALKLIEKHGYAEKQKEIEAYHQGMADYALDKKLPKPLRPSFISPAGQLSETRIIQDARYEKKLSKPDYDFLATLVSDLLSQASRGIPVLRAEPARPPPAMPLPSSA